MANLLDIRRRIKSVKNTQQITKAMKMVSAAKLKRAQERAVSARPFAVKMAEVLADLAAHAGEDFHHPLLDRRATSDTCSSSSPPTRAWPARSTRTSSS